MTGYGRKVLGFAYVTEFDGRRSYRHFVAKLDCGHYAYGAREGQRTAQCRSCFGVVERLRLADEYESQGHIKNAGRLRAEAEKIARPNFTLAAPLAVTEQAS